MRALILGALLAGCGGGVDKAAHCASTFGDALTDGFGRFDGTLRAIVPPADDACADVNGTHLVLQLDADDVTYRMVVDVVSDQGSPDVGYFTVDASLVGASFSPGWRLSHDLGAELDYPTTLSVHSTSFVPHVEADLVRLVTDQLKIGGYLSVFATSMTEHDSAHLVHRVGNGTDGAIVIDPLGSPRYLLFKFAGDTF